MNDLWTWNRLTETIAEHDPNNVKRALRKIYEGWGRDFSGLYVYLERWNRQMTRYDYTAANTRDGKDRIRHRIQTTFGFLPTLNAFEKGLASYLDS